MAAKKEKKNQMLIDIEDEAEIIRLKKSNKNGKNLFLEVQKSVQKKL